MTHPAAALLDDVHSTPHTGLPSSIHPRAPAERLSLCHIGQAPEVAPATEAAAQHVAAPQDVHLCSQLAIKAWKQEEHVQVF